jgi:translation elongation factor EF-Ts
MLSDEQVKDQIVALVKSSMNASGATDTVQAICVRVAALNPEDYTADEVFHLCLALQRDAQISFLMAADGTISVY